MTTEPTLQDKFAEFDALPKEVRDLLKQTAFSYSTVGISQRIVARGLAQALKEMKDRDSAIWREVFEKDFGSPYPCKEPRS